MASLFILVCFSLGTFISINYPKRPQGTRVALRANCFTLQKSRVHDNKGNPQEKILEYLGFWGFN